MVGHVRLYHSCPTRFPQCTLAWVNPLSRQVLFHFQVELNRKFRLHHLYIQERAGTSTYIDTRTVFLSKYLKKGNYVLVPTMFQHGRTSEFLLRIFCEVPVQLRCRFLGQPCQLLFWALPPSPNPIGPLPLDGYSEGQVVQVRFN